MSRRASAVLAAAGLLAACRLDLTGAACQDDSNCPVRQYCARAITESTGACKSGVGPPPLDVDFIVDADHRLIPLGGTAQAYAIAVVNDGGLVVPDGGVVTDLVDWTTDPTGIISVTNDPGSPKGAITALAPGQTVLTGSIIVDHVPLTGSVPVVVSNAELLNVLVVTDRPTYAFNTGGTAAATGFFTDGTHADLTSLVQWSSSTPSILSVSNASGNWGRLSALATGDVRLQATYQKLEGDAGVQVSAATLVALSISPVHPRGSAGSLLQLDATGLFSDGTVQSMTRSVQWSLDSAAVGYFGPGTPGSVTLLSAGTATVQAVAGTVRGTAPLEVGTAVPVQLEIDPPWPDPLAVGTVTQLGAWGTDSAGVVGAPPVLWRGGDSTAGLSPSGTLEATDAGLAVLVAQSGPLDATVTVEVTDRPTVSLLIWPPVAFTPVGTSGRVALERTDDDGAVQDLSTTAGWRPAPMDAGYPISAAVDVDTGEEGGTVRMRQAGMAAVQAVLPGRRAVSMVSAPTDLPLFLEVVPDAVALSSAGRSHLTAVAHWPDGTVSDVTAATSWTSDAPLLAAAGNGPAAGTVLGLDTGTARIHAAFKGLSAMAQLTLEAGAATLEAWPPRSTVGLGTAAPLSASLLSPSGDSSDVTPDVTWVSSDPRIAFVTNAPTAGREIVGRSTGSVTLLGRIDGWVGQASARVTPATLSTVEIQPPPALLRWLPASFQAVGHFDDGSSQDVTGQVSWSTSNPARLRIRGTGPDRGRSVVQATAPGTVVVTARPRGGPSFTTAGLTVNPTALVAVEVQGSGLVVGTQGRLVALGHGADGTTVDVTALAGWASSDPTVATISSLVRPGRIRGLRVGSTVVSAELQGVVGTLSLPVGGEAVMALDVAAPSMLSSGDLSQASASVHLAGGGTQLASDDVLWLTDAPDVLSVSNAPGGRGRLAALSPGTATLKARSRIPGATGLEATAIVTVAPAQVTARAPAR